MITVAIERNRRVYVYGENEEKILFSQPGELYNYTCESVAIIRNGWLYIYDEKGNIVFNIKQ